MTKKLINIGCTANEGRSKPSQIMGNNHLVAIGAADEYSVISSGTGVDAIRRGEASIGFMISTITMAKERGDVYFNNELALIDGAIKSGDEKTLRSLYETATKMFVEEEHSYRAELLPELGIVGELKENQDQTIARPDVIAVLTMAESNNDQAVEIHQAAGYHLAAEQPKVGQMFEKDGNITLVSVLSAYALDDPTVELVNAFGKGRDQYNATLEALMDHVPKAIDRLVA